MIYPIKIDLVPLLENLVAAIQPYAKANNIKLKLLPVKDHVEIYHHPEFIIPELTKLMCRTIAFTPQDFEVELELPIQDDNNEDNLVLFIRNTGANLEALQDHIFNEIKLRPEISKTEANGTQFKIQLPVIRYEETNEEEVTHQLETKSAVFVSPFYEKFREHLKNHFTSIKNLERTADARSQRDGIFLKKVNAVILAHLDKEGFDTVTLGRALALSRAQLYRRLKPLIGFSPAHYIRYVRLSKAKEFLENKDLTVSEVAYNTGFASHSHFTRAFREQFGFKPSEICCQLQGQDSEYLGKTSDLSEWNYQ